MKKFFMTLVAVAMAVSVNAQGYFGGSIGVASVKNGGADAETTYKFVPEIGWNFNSEWAAGVAFGYQKGACDLQYGSYGQDVDTEILSVNPYVRYTAWNTKYVNVFVDGGIGLASIKDVGTEFNLGLRPGVAVNFNDKISFVAHVGFVGFDSFSPKGDGDSSNMVGVDLNGNNILFGLYFSF
jgi:hypothetical protein